MGVGVFSFGIGGGVSGMDLVPGSVVWSEGTPAGASGVTAGWPDGVGVAAGAAVWAGAGVGVPVFAGAGVDAGSGVGVWVGVGAGVGVSVGVGAGVGEGDGVGVTGRVPGIRQPQTRQTSSPVSGST